MVRKGGIQAGTRDEEEILTEQQQKFCEYYYSSRNKVQSYLLAYPKSTYNTASSSSCALLKLPRIKKYLDKLEDRKNAMIAIANDKIMRDSIEAIDLLIATAKKNLLISNLQLPDPRDKKAVADFSTKQNLDIANSLRSISVVFFGIPDAKMRLMGGDAIAEEINNRIRQGEYYFDEDAEFEEETSLV